MSTDYKGKIMYSMTQAKFNELREANGGKLPAQYANSYVYTDAEDVNLSCLRPVLLWENDSPTLSFPQRTIEDIIPNNCDYFEIGYRYDTTNNFQKSDLIKADAGVRGLLSFVNTPNIMLARALTINSKTSISFSASYRGNGSSESMDNTTIVPLYVIGYTKEPAMIYTGAELFGSDTVEIKDGVISANKQIKLLWENLDPTQSISSGTISLNSSDYDFLIFLCYNATWDLSETIIGVATKGKEAKIHRVDTNGYYNTNGDSVYQTDRYLKYVNDTTYTIEKCNSRVWLSQSSSVNGTANDRNIPYKVLGVKL